MARKRKPSAIGYLVREPLPLAEDRRGLAISTLGKVIKRGWDWLGVTPATPEQIGGLIEVPALAECLTLNKADFIRSGVRGATYLAYRKAIQEAVSRQLARWGDAREAAEESRRRAARPVERDLERVLVEMADDFPLLATLVERREGGQRKLPIGIPGAADARNLVATSLAGASEVREASESGSDVAPTTDATATPTEPRGKPVEETAGQAGREPADVLGAALTLPGSRGPRRPAR